MSINRVATLAIFAILVASTFSLLPAAASSPPGSVVVQTNPNSSIGFKGGNGGGHGGGGGGSFTCPTIPGADSSSCSTNWSGYAVTASSGVTSVSGSWYVPALSCPSSGTTYVAIWVGIDGYSDSTVEQTGVMGQCSNGVASYSAWYEFYPSASVTVFTVAPNDAIIASVTALGSSSFSVSISDSTSGQRYTITGTVSGAGQSSAEWIVERPALCIAAHCSLTTLANFGSDTFTSSSATIGVNSGSISAFTNVAITMVGGSKGPILAEPSSLSTDGTSFSVAYG
ncbi:MAG: hypothetical protein JRN20_03980 [Nitrososphaerota archaeon]|nr:hypothetical protein [Nitrososphaerota archaeon]